MANTRGVFSLPDIQERVFFNTWLPLVMYGFLLVLFLWHLEVPNTGYFGGGGPGPTTTMDKVTYASDTTAAVPGAALSAARYGLAATGNSTARILWWWSSWSKNNNG
jgi:hypothetical protein